MLQMSIPSTGPNWVIGHRLDANSIAMIFLKKQRANYFNLIPLRGKKIFNSIGRIGIEKAPRGTCMWCDPTRWHAKIDGAISICISHGIKKRGLSDWGRYTWPVTKYTNRQSPSISCTAPTTADCFRATRCANLISVSIQIPTRASLLKNVHILARA